MNVSRSLFKAENVPTCQSFTPAPLFLKPYIITAVYDDDFFPAETTGARFRPQATRRGRRGGGVRWRGREGKG